jgi:hypothetical protein
MAKKGNSTLAENGGETLMTFIQAMELMSQRWETAALKGPADARHEHQAMRELFEWSRKWEHTDISKAICSVMEEGKRRRARGPAFDQIAIALTVVVLEKIGTKPATAKKEVATRFHTTLRNVQGYVAKLGATPELRQIVDVTVTGWIQEGMYATPPMLGLRLTQEEMQKLNELTQEEERKLDEMLAQDEN